MATITGTVCRIAIALVLALGAVGWGGAAQAERLDDLARDGEARVALEALARQPEAMRLAALHVASRPDLVVRVEGIRAWSSRGFEEILEGRSEEERANFWELVRYPELVEALAEPDGVTDLELLVANYPTDVRRSALETVRSSSGAIVRMRDLQHETDDSFAEITEDLAPELASALRTVSDAPEVMSVLSENLKLTVALGALWEHDPAEVEKDLAELGVEVARQDALARDEWSRAVKEDPDLREQVESAAEEWERENGVRARRESNETVVYVDARPYPYWHGYPLFAADVFVPAAHSHALWYPRSYWRHFGYSYYGPHHSLVVFDVPSFAFLYWLGWRYPSHHYRTHYAHHQRVRYVQRFAHHGRRRHHAHHYVQRIHDRHRGDRDRNHFRDRDRDRRDGHRERRHVRLQDRDDRHHRDLRARDGRNHRDLRARDSDGNQLRSREARNRRHARSEAPRTEIRGSAAPRAARRSVSRQGPREVRPEVQRERREAKPRAVASGKREHRENRRASAREGRPRDRMAQLRPKRPKSRPTARPAPRMANPPKMKSASRQRVEAPRRVAKAQPRPGKKPAARPRSNGQPQAKRAHKPQRRGKRASKR